jgi:hypothetical protein
MAAAGDKRLYDLPAKPYWSDITGIFIPISKIKFEPQISSGGKS